MITGISGFVFLVPKWPFRDGDLFFKNWFAEAPIIMVLFGCVLFGPRCPKKGKFGPPRLKTETFD